MSVLSLPRCAACDVLVRRDHVCGHGTRTGYQRGCDCVDCREANAIYKRNRQQAAKRRAS